MHFRVFSLGQGTKRKIFLGLLKFQIFLGFLKFLIFFFGGGGQTIDTGPEPTHIEQMRVPPGLAAYQTINNN